MSKKPKDISGMKFGRLTAVKCLGVVQGDTTWLFVCDCGNKKSAAGWAVHGGKIKSCGCLRKDVLSLPRTHGESKRGMHSFEYKCWREMIHRCNSKDPHKVKHYSGRGITVCERWKKYSNFLEDMGRAPGEGYSVDRKDNDKGYFKENCRWATWIEQARNKRNSVKISYNGKKMGPDELSEIIMIPACTIRYRKQRKWTDLEIIETPVGQKRASR